MADLNTRGFIIDSPNALITTTSGDYQCITAESGEVNFSGETLKINGGWSFAPLTEIDTTKGVEVSMTDALMQFDMFKLTTGGTVANSAIAYDEFGVKFTVGVAATPTITIPAVIVASSMRINGFTETTGTTPTATQFVVTIGATDTTVTFNSSNAALDVYPSYQITTAATANTLSVQTTDFSRSGRTVLKFPVYADPDEASADIVGYMNLVIYKAKINAATKIGGSKKSASTFNITMTALDPKRADAKWFDMTFNPVA